MALYTRAAENKRLLSATELSPGQWASSLTFATIFAKVSRKRLETERTGIADEEDKIGKFVGIPYDWRRPTRERLKRGIWNPQERSIFVPKAYGWGYGLNLWEVARRLRLVGRSPR